MPTNKPGTGTALAGGAVLRVTPEELKKQQQLITDNIAIMVQRYNIILSLGINFASFWEGDAFEYNRRQLSAVLDDLGDVVQQISIRPSQLNAISGIYELVEEYNQQMAAQLDRDIIF